MPNKKKAENVTSENVDTIKVTDGAENRQEVEEQLSGASLDKLTIEKEEDRKEAEEGNENSAEKKAKAKRTAGKKIVEGKETAKRGAKKAETGKKEEAQEKQVYIQYAGKEILLAVVEETIKKAWEAEGHRASSIKKLDIYIKPEESAAYYVINSKNKGRVDL